MGIETVKLKAKSYETFHNNFLRNRKTLNVKSVHQSGECKYRPSSATGCPCSLMRTLMTNGAFRRAFIHPTTTLGISAFNHTIQINGFVLPNSSFSGTAQLQTLFFINQQEWQLLAGECALQYTGRGRHQR